MSFRNFSDNSDYCFQYLNLSNNTVNYVGIIKLDYLLPNNVYAHNNNRPILIDYTEDVIHYGTKFPKAKIGDILYYSVRRGENMERDGTPVGVCVINGYNMPDGMTRFMALTPPEESTNQFSTWDNHGTYKMNYSYLKYYKVLPVISPSNKVFPEYNINDMKDYTSITQIINDASVNMGNNPENLDKREPIIVVPALVQTKDSSVTPEYLMKALKQTTNYIQQIHSDGVPSTSDDYMAYHNLWGTASLKPNWIKDGCTTIMPPPYRTADPSLNIATVHSYSTSLTSSPLSDFNGYENTKAFIDYDMQNSTSAGKGIYEYTTKLLYYADGHTVPIIAWNYHKALTNKYKDLTLVNDVPKYKPGDWYLPSCGELNLVMARWATILNAIIKAGKSIGVDYHMSDSSIYPTSTAWDLDYVWAFDANTCAFKTIRRIPSSETGIDGVYAVFPMRKL